MVFLNFLRGFEVDRNACNVAETMIFLRTDVFFFTSIRTQSETKNVDFPIIFIMLLRTGTRMQCTDLTKDEKKVSSLISNVIWENISPSKAR